MSAGVTPALFPAAPPHNLPPPTSDLFGREADLATVRQALALAPLVTLVGPGGVGKTRVALATAAPLLDRFPDGVWLVELAPLADPALLPGTVAQVLRLREEAGRPLLHTLIAYLRDRRLLLVLDNCEHLRAACADLVDALLPAAPGLRVLATSRRPLDAAGERRVPMAPLALPPTGTAMDPREIARAPAVALFVARAQAVEPSFTLDHDNAESVAAVCARLDGLPLAIELAAARVKLRTPAAVLAELDDRLRVLVGGRRGLPARQRTVRGLLDWSYTLLSPGEQALFARLSVFAGGWTAEAARAVCALDDDLPMPVEEGLASLVAQSLVQPARAGRYGMLETVREYAAYALARLSGEEDEAAVRRQHAAFFLTLAEQAAPRLTGQEQGSWLDRLEEEYDNLRAALAWSQEQEHGDAHVRFGAALAQFWLVRGHPSEGRRWLEAILARAGDTPSAPRATALLGAANLAWSQGDYDRARALLQESLSVARAVKDARAITGALQGLGILHSLRSEYAHARQIFEQALALAIQEDDRERRAALLTNLGNDAMVQGEYERACALYDEALALDRSLGDTRGIARLLYNLSLLADLRGDDERRLALLHESLAAHRALRDRSGIVNVLALLGDLLFQQGDDEQARALLHEALTLARANGDRRSVAMVLHQLGQRAFARGEWAEAREVRAEALSLSCAVEDRRNVALGLELLAQIAQVEERLRTAALLCGAAATLRATIGVPHSLPEQAIVERVRDAARADLGEDAFVASWAEGEALPLREAVSLALKDTPWSGAQW